MSGVIASPLGKSNLMLSSIYWLDEIASSWRLGAMPRNDIQYQEQYNNSAVSIIKNKEENPYAVIQYQ